METRGNKERMLGQKSPCPRLVICCGETGDGRKWINYVTADWSVGYANG